jgi:hypothetical protein
LLKKSKKDTNSGRREISIELEDLERSQGELNTKACK